jgi:hypothetical protein
MNIISNKPSNIEVRAIDGSMSMTLTPFGRKYSESTTMFAREDRAADGTLRRDYTASKKTFTLAYSELTGLDLQRIEDLYENYASRELLLVVRRLRASVFNFVYSYVDDEYKVLIKAFSKSRVLAVHGGLWENVTIEFEEV